jgi:hypothetical protein
MYYEGYSIVGKIASLVMGFLIVTILLLVPIIVALEVSYISFPIVRDATDSLIIKLEGKGIEKFTSGVVLRDAREAVRRADMSTTGRSPMFEYVLLKSKSMMFLMYMLAFVGMSTDTAIAFVAHLLKPILKLFVQ